MSTETTVQQAGGMLAKAIEDFLDEVRSDDGDPWSERPTQNIFKSWHPLQKALTAWKAALS